MKVATGYIFYFLLAIMAFTFSLIIFVFKPFRRLLHKVQSRYNHILNNHIVQFIVYFSFAIVGIILIESAYSFFKIHSHLFSQSNIIGEHGLDNLDLLHSHNGNQGHSFEDTILSLKEYKEYYMSERNIMLTSSAFFAYFIFDRLFFNIRKLADIENQINNPDQKSVFEEEKTEGKLKSQ